MMGLFAHGAPRTIRVRRHPLATGHSLVREGDIATARRRSYAIGIALNATIWIGVAAIIAGVR